MILYKNVDIKDLESILTKGILSLNVSGNNNWDDGKRADNSCDVVYHQREFPVKVYGDLTFQAGKYEALDVVLGDARGRNWWCVMFPSLCFVDGTYSIVPDNSKEKLQKVLTKEEYETISENETLKVQYAFKVTEWWNSAKEQILKIVE